MWKIGAIGQRPKEERQDRNGQPGEGVLAGVPSSAQFPQLSGTAALSDVGHRTQRQKSEEYRRPHRRGIRTSPSIESYCIKFHIKVNYVG